VERWLDLAGGRAIFPALFYEGNYRQI